jgi:hypothetical protein
VVIAKCVTAYHADRIARMTAPAMTGQEWRVQKPIVRTTRVVMVFMSTSASKTGV